MQHFINFDTIVDFLFHRKDLTGVLHSKMRQWTQKRPPQYMYQICKLFSLRCYQTAFSSRFFYGTLISTAVKWLPWIEEDKWNDVLFSKLKCCEVNEFYVLESFKLCVCVIKYFRHTSGKFSKFLLLLFSFFFTSSDDFFKKILMWNMNERHLCVMYNV